MPGKTPQFGQPPQGVLGGEVRGWIEHVIVPALVSKFLKETTSSKDGLKDNAQPNSGERMEGHEVRNLRQVFVRSPAGSVH
jgi:hypothetical protein